MTVTSVSGVTANGLTVSVANPTTTPQITVGTNVTGVVKANGTGFVPAVSGTDYADGNTVYNVLNVRDYGAVGNGVTDDSAAFLAAFTAAAGNTTNTFTINNRGTRTIYVPPGTYIIAQPQHFIAPGLGVAVDGIKFQGAGCEVTELVYNPGAATAAYDATAGGTAATHVNATTMSWTHTLGTAATAIVVGISLYGYTGPNTNWTRSVTCGGVAMTSLGSVQLDSTGEGFVELWGLIGPPTGSQTINVSYTQSSDTPYLVGGSVSYTNVAAFGSLLTDYGNGTSITSGSVTTTSGSIVVAAQATYDTTIGSLSNTSRINYPTSATANYATLAMQDVVSSGSSNTLTATGGASQNWGSVAVQLIPTTAMCFNQNNYLELTFEDMTFYSETATATWMQSYSTGQAQNYVFNRVNWQGSWLYGLNLTGTNNNSEMTFFHCEIHGNWTAFLYVGPTVGSVGDQFLNYNFFATQVEYTTGNFVDMAYGGNVNVWGGSYIHLGNGSQTTSSPQCFFRLGAGSAYPGSGTPRLLVQGIRVEHRHDFSSLIQCDWPWGVVAFIGCSTDAFAPLLANPNSVIQVQFGVNNQSYPIVTFDNCSLMGIHEYHFNSNSWNQDKSIQYRNCWITTNPNAAAFISYINDDSDANTSGAPPIQFTGCIGSNSIDSDSPTELFDCTVGWPAAMNAVVSPKTVSIQMAYGGLPFVTQPTTTVNLPLNAVITKVRSYGGTAGSANNTNWSYTLTDANSATIATVALGTPWNAGWSYDSGDLFHQCSTTNKRELTLTAANVNQNQPDTYFFIDYLA